MYVIIHINVYNFAVAIIMLVLVYRIYKHMM